MKYHFVIKVFGGVNCSARSFEFIISLLWNVIFKLKFLKTDSGLVKIMSVRSKTFTIFKICFTFRIYK